MFDNAIFSTMEEPKNIFIYRLKNKWSVTEIESIFNKWENIKSKLSIGKFLPQNMMETMQYYNTYLQAAITLRERNVEHKNHIRK